jgi:hypothetical protein
MIGFGAIRRGEGCQELLSSRLRCVALVVVGLQKSNRERRRVRGLHEKKKRLARLVSNIDKYRRYLFVLLLSHLSPYRRVLYSYPCRAFQLCEL